MCRISSTGTQALSTACRKSESLKRLFIGGNLFNEEDLKPLVSAAMQSSSLELLSLGDETWLSKETAELAKKAMAQRTVLHVLYKGARTATVRPADFSAILVDRCKFLAMKPKKRKLKREMGEFFARKIRDGAKYSSAEEFAAMLKEFKAKIDDTLVGKIVENWTVNVGKGKKMDLEGLCNYYLAKHPYELIEKPAIAKKKESKKKKKSKKKN